MLKGHDIQPDCCDNCMTAKIPHVQMSSRYRDDSADWGADINPPMMFCGKCNIVYYCSKVRGSESAYQHSILTPKQTCQKAAWVDHHKAECEALCVLKKAGLFGNGDMPEAREFVRLLAIARASRVTHTVLEEIRAIPYAESWTEESVQKMVGLIKNCMKSAIREEDLVKLFNSMKSNLIPISVPLIFRTANNDPTLMVTWGIGKCLEPFAAMMSHSCAPNTYAVHEGSELRIRAARDIAAGEELTRSLRPDFADFEDRQYWLDANFRFTCACELCKKGNIQPAEDLLEQMIKLIEIDLLHVHRNLPEVEKGIADMRAAGFGWGTWPMRILHHHLIRAHNATGKPAESLKDLLRIRYLVEPAQDPLVTPEERVHTLYLLHALIDAAVYGPCNARNEFPKVVRNVGIKIMLHTRAILTGEVEQAFSKNSQVAGFQRNLMVSTKTCGHVQKEFQGTLVPLAESAEEREEFVKGMNVLLKWAGIPVLSESEHMAFCPYETV
ncbi:hypothetical protein B0J14DRAFT_577949 [Halenospora varia]|nr:hypothetical protein B0J14DRAFT_577949 [Halenospora varia]